MRFKTTRVASFPMCDICTDQGISNPAQYDGKTIYGYWANMCGKHHKAIGLGVGLGIGQKFVIHAEKS